MKGTGNCQEKEVVYAGQCSKHIFLFTGHIREQLSERFSKHREDTKSRPDNEALSKISLRIFPSQCDYISILMWLYCYIPPKTYHED